MTSASIPTGVSWGNGRPSPRALGLAVLGISAWTCFSCGDAGHRSSPGGASTGMERPWLEDVAADWGVDFVHSSGSERRFLFPEILAGGVALFDYDGDARLDIYLVQGGDGLVQPAPESGTNRLYRNLGPGPDGSPRFEDVTAASGAGDRGYGMGAACGDFDGDGDVDLYVTNVGPNVLYRNEGDGTFTEVAAAAGVDHPGWGTSTTFVDYDRDGHADLFVVNYVDWSADQEQECFSSSRDHVRSYCSPRIYGAPARDVLYRNRGDGTFEDVTEASGVARAWGNGLGLAWGDFDGDGRTDLYVANDGTPNNLWMQTQAGRFEDRGLLLGCAVGAQGQAEAGMGVIAADLEGDGDLDILLAHLRGEPNTVYLQDGGLFRERTAHVGLGASTRLYTGFGLVLADLDGDSLRDLFVANGNVLREDPYYDPERPYAEPDQLFRGTPEGRFEEVRPAAGTAELRVSVSRAAAAGDLDGDGDTDLVVVHADEPVAVLENLLGQDRSWIGLRVLDEAGRDACDAEVRVRIGELDLRRRVRTTFSFQASNDPRLQIGLGAARGLARVLVRWPSGFEREFEGLELGRYHLLTPAP